MSTVIKVQDVNFAYDYRPILEGINLEVRDKDFLAVIGPNGGGKTTLLRVILGALKPSSGQVSVLGMPPKKARRKIGYVPQHGSYDFDFPITALDVVLTGRLGVKSFFPRYGPQDYELAKGVMKTLGIEGLASDSYGELSGGQKQRVLISRALVTQPQILILDEPTASVDSRVEQDIYELLTKLNEKVTIIIVSHDLGFVSSYVNKVACLNRRLVINTVEEITKEVIAGMYQSPVEMIEHQCAL